MTDLEAKISSEFANGDPTVQGATQIKQPMVLRISYKRLVPIVAALLIIGGGIITYFAGNRKAPQAPVISTVQPQVAGVQAASVETAPEPPTVSTNHAKTTVKPVASIPAHATTPTPQPTPTIDHETTDLVDDIVDTVDHVVDHVLRTVDSVTSSVL